MESVVGKSVIVEVRGQLLPAVVRACTEPLTTLTSDFSLVDVSPHTYLLYIVSTDHSILWSGLEEIII